MSLFLAQSPQVGAVIALGYPLRDFSTPATVLSVDIDGKKHDATVTTLPFYTRA